MPFNGGSARVYSPPLARISHGDSREIFSCSALPGLHLSPALCKSRPAAYWPVHCLSHGSVGL